MFPIMWVADMRFFLPVFFVMTMCNVHMVSVNRMLNMIVNDGTNMYSTPDILSYITVCVSWKERMN